MGQKRGQAAVSILTSASICDGVPVVFLLYASPPPRPYSAPSFELYFIPNAWVRHQHAPSWILHAADGVSNDKRAPHWKTFLPLFSTTPNAVFVPLSSMLWARIVRACGLRKDAKSITLAPSCVAVSLFRYLSAPLGCISYTPSWCHYKSFSFL